MGSRGGSGGNRLQESGPNKLNWGAVLRGCRRPAVQLRRKGTRVRAGFMPALLAFVRSRPAGVLFATAACLLAAGCSPGADSPAYPAIFATPHDVPAPQADAPMNSAQVQKATQDLITERDHLNAQAPPNSQGQAAMSGTAAQPAVKAAKAATPAKKKAAKIAAERTAAAPPATTASAQGAGVQDAGAEAAGAGSKP